MKTSMRLLSQMLGPYILVLPEHLLVKYSIIPPNLMQVPTSSRNQREIIPCSIDMSSLLKGACKDRQTVAKLGIV